MDTQPLSLAHRALLQPRLRAIQVPISEFCFANLYLFRAVHRYEVLTDGSEVWIRGRSYSGQTFILPTLDPRDSEPESLSRAAAWAEYIYPVPEGWLDAFPGGDWVVTSDEGDSDYIYLTERIATYAGRAMHRKKNLLNAFLREHRAEALPLTGDRVRDALSILDAWQDESGQALSDTDYSPCRESLERMDDLVLCGGIFYADGEPAGFVHGEELSEDTYALHFAKGLIRFKGVYQYMFNRFASVLPAKYRYLNLEQDLGRDALRQSKESYVPERKLKKCRVRPAS